MKFDTWMVGGASTDPPQSFVQASKFQLIRFGRTSPERVSWYMNLTTKLTLHIIVDVRSVSCAVNGLQRAFWVGGGVTLTRQWIP